MKLTKFFFYTILISCLFLSAISSYASSEPLKIGVSLSLTGRFSEMGNAQMKGYRLWEKHVNERGGILGRKVSIFIYDDKSEADMAKAIYRRMITEEKVDFLFGPYSSPITHAVLPIAEEHDYPLLITGASGSSIWEKGYKNAIGVYTPSDRVPLDFLELLIKHKIKKIAIVYADDAFSIDLANGAISYAKKLQMEILLSESFKKDTRDLTYLAKKVKDSGAQALIVGGHFNEALDMRIALKAINYYPRAYYASVGVAYNEYYAKLKEDANLTFSSSLWDVRAGFPLARKFYDDYVSNFKESPQYHSAIAYAGGQVLEEAIRRSGTFDRKKVRDTFFKMDIFTIIGRYGIDKTGRQIRQHVYLIQWQKGKKEIIWPQSLATVKPIFK